MSYIFMPNVLHSKRYFIINKWLKLICSMIMYIFDSLEICLNYAQ